MIAGLAAWVLASCGETERLEPPGICEDGPTLFGRPNANTGLGDGECGPACSCADGTFAPAPLDDAALAGLRAWTLVEPYPEPIEDPWATSGPAPEPSDAVCGFLADGDARYRLETFADGASAVDAGARVTHTGACGVCSTLEDLAVYASIPDLTEPVRECGLAHLGDPVEDLVGCIGELGFTRPCAWIWAWNTRNTQRECLAPCLAALDAPYHTPDGALNACLQCDEDVSGPVFKAVAGRTRRNTGLPNAMCRPCSEVTALEHTYP